MHEDPRTTLLESPMGRLQVIAVAITVGLNALDGFDVVSISFTCFALSAYSGYSAASASIIVASSRTE